MLFFENFMPNRINKLNLPIPPWVNRMYRGLGLKALVNGFVRYTFVGEYFERFVQDVVVDQQSSESVNPEATKAQQGEIRIAG